MNPVDPSTVTWMVSARAASQMSNVRLAFGDGYGAQRTAFKKFLCEYFSQGQCTARQGRSIAPLGLGVVGAGGKELKVRWMTPGGGKSGGLRLAVAVWCTERRVMICGAWQRKEGPSDAEFAEEFAGI